LNELHKGIQSFLNQFKSVKLKTEDGEASYVEVVDAERNVFLAPKIVADAESAEAGKSSSSTSQR